MARVNLDKEEIQEQAEVKSTDSPVFDFRQIFDKVVHNQKDKREQMKKAPENVESKPAKNEVLQRSIQKLEHLREKSYDKEV